MQRMDDATFIAWLAEAGITGAEPKSGRTWLYFGAAQDATRTWEAPDAGEARDAWLAAVVRAASAGGPWWLWPRGGGGWYGGFASAEGIAAAAGAAGVPRDFGGALGFGADETEPMMGLLRAFAAWPWNGGDDVYLVPADQSCVVMLCHDEEIHVFAPDRERLRTFGEDVRM
ncbi:hypothetical protein [Longimicrobium sp.]|uniref:hypothetical protein n=1 Tax=Longimicrobium sp. TaxID=2029185 RepID=UPI002E316585|nr:hypothetical protein [Longimicrobium sp.]HEX6037381.1 hypothetical protein [Longimicrobium sp.]